MSTIKENYQKWLTETKNHKDLFEELLAIENDDDGISDRFFKDLEFGTGGLRGVIGAGTNRMNIFTVSRATQGFANYILKTNGKNSSVAIAFDSRNKSDEFAKATACVFAANGIKVYIYKELMPTPMLSFAVRSLGCAGGVVVTASHNPAKYNGYKAYGADGCQLGIEPSNKVISIVDELDFFEDVKTCDFLDAIKEGKVEFIKNEVVTDFLNEAKKCSIHPEILKNSNLEVIYTPLNGTGNKPVRTLLKEVGVENVKVVPEQELPDGNFPTAPFPNPEIRQAFECALNLAEKSPADILIATDPDADRVGVAVKSKNEYVLVSGNDMGALLLNYVLEERTKLKTMPKNPIVVMTIVTSPICEKIAKHFGVEVKNVLTGFKFIGEQITLLEAKNEESRYVFGFEESYGYLSGTHVRDKDAVSSAMLICEMATYYKNQGKTLLDILDEIHKKFGYYVNTQLNFTCEGEKGITRMNEIMTSLRVNPPKTIGENIVLNISDYGRSVHFDVCSEEKEVINLPQSNVIAFEMDGGSKAVVRPSGTEPKIKVYVTTCEKTLEESLKLTEEISKNITKKLGF